jgi:hypothetical protein
MHGLILAELQRYVHTNVGPQAWVDACRIARVSSTTYTLHHEYPESDLAALVAAGAQVLNVPAQALLEDFGHFMVPGLMTVCAPHLPPSWGALDVLESQERHLLLAERLTGRAVTPAVVLAERLSEREVRITYGSQRRLCGLTRGIVRGILSHFREVGAVRETDCMLRGYPQCIIHVTRIGN